MWLFSKDGFFSVVKNRYCKDGDLAVRSRCKDDLIRFCKVTKTPQKGIKVFPDADYRFRVHVTAETWAKYAGACSMNIDYPNFKTAVHSVDPSIRRSHAMHECWAAMNNFQEGRQL